MASYLSQVLVLVLSLSAVALADEYNNHDNGFVDHHVDNLGAPVVKRTIRVHEVSPPPAAADGSQVPVSTGNPPSNTLTNNVQVKPDISVHVPTGVQQVPVGDDRQQSPQNLAMQSGNLQDLARLDSDNLGQNMAIDSGNMMMSGAANSGNMRQQLVTNSGNSEVVHMDGVGNSKVTKISNSGNNELMDASNMMNSKSSPVFPGLPLGLGSPKNPLVQINMNEMGAARFEQQRPQFPMPMPLAQPMWPFQYYPAQLMSTVMPQSGLPIADVDQLPRSMARKAKRAAREMARAASQPMQLMMAPPQVPQFAPTMYAMAPGMLGQPTMMMMPAPVVTVDPFAMEREARRQRRQQRRREAAKRAALKRKHREERNEPQPSPTERQVVVVEEKQHPVVEQPQVKVRETAPVRRQHIIEERVVPVPVPAPTTTTPAPEIEYETIRVPKGQLKQIPGFDPRNLVQH